MHSLENGVYPAALRKSRTGPAFGRTRGRKFVHQWQAAPLVTEVSFWSAAVSVRLKQSPVEFL
jgi:hypothetical protein